MDNILREQVRFKIEEIDRLFSEYELIFIKVGSVEPDIFDMTILGSVLHSFYNGLENIFKLIAKNIDENVPVGVKSHQELLRQMSMDTNKRNKLFNEETYYQLREYATFRHFYRHAYSFQLSWEKMKPLTDDVICFWNKIKKDIEDFILTMERIEGGKSE